MFLTSVIIVLREVLEAALLLSIFFSVATRMLYSRRWLAVAVASGIVAAILYGNSIGPISEAFDGIGQELLNAAIQLIIAAILYFVVIKIAVSRSIDKSKTSLGIAMGIAIVLAITREGSEIYIYLVGFIHIKDAFNSVVFGGLLGAGIGFSIGALFFFWLLAIPLQKISITISILLSAVAAGMVSQAINLFIQVDWLSAQQPVINMENWLPESSIPGQLLYALVGYESRPGALQLTCYLATFFSLLFVSLLGYYFNHAKNPR